MKNIQNTNQIKKNDLIDISTMCLDNMSHKYDLTQFQSCVVERVNTDNPGLRNNRTFRKYFQLILTYKDDVNLDEVSHRWDSRSQRIYYKKH